MKYRYSLFTFFLFWACSQVDKSTTVSRHPAYDSLFSIGYGAASKSDSSFMISVEAATGDTIISKGYSFNGDTIAYQKKGKWIVVDPLQLVQSLAFITRHDQRLWQTHWKENVCIYRTSLIQINDTTVGFRVYYDSSSSANIIKQ